MWLLSLDIREDVTAEERKLYHICRMINSRSVVSIGRIMHINFVKKLSKLLTAQGRPYDMKFVTSLLNYLRSKQK
jgi:hypothetical protein